MPISATGLTAAVTRGVRLLVGLRSLVSELTLAVVVSEPLGGVVTTRVRLLIWPLARFPRLQFTTLFFFTASAPTEIYALSPHDALPTSTLLATDGPKLVSEIV